MKKLWLILAIILILQTTAFAKAPKDDITVLFALESEYAYTGGKVVNSGAKPFMYKKKSYVPVRFTVENSGGKITKVTDKNLTIEIKGKSYDLSLQDAKVYNSVTYVMASHLSPILGLNTVWSDGLVGFAKTPQSFTEQEIDDLKFKLGFVTYTDRYNKEVSLYQNSVIYKEGAEYKIVNGKAEKTYNVPYMKNNNLYVSLIDTAKALGGEISVLDEDKNYAIKYNYKNYYFSKDYVEYIEGVPYAPINSIAKEMKISSRELDGIFEITGILKEYTKEEIETFNSLLQTGKEQHKEQDEIVFSVSSGLYTDAFTLYLSSEGNKILYTLDGSEPDKNSKVYKDGIKIYDRTSDKNKLSSYTTIVEKGYTPPKTNVFKGTVVKARAILPDGTLGRIVQNTYLVSKTIHSKYMGTKIVSISTNEDNLFGEKGIYRYPNYLTVGNPNEVSGYIEVFDKNGKSVVSQSAGIRLNGAGTRALPQKSFRIYARENANYFKGTSKTLKYDFFEGKVKDVNGQAINEYKRIILRNAGDDYSKYFMRDTLAQKIGSQLGLDTQGYSPSAVFVNGEFWGIYLIRERYDNNYFKYHYNLSDNKDVAMIEIANDPLKATLSEGDEEDLKEFNSDAYFIIDNDMSVEENYKKAEENFDLDNFIDLYIANIFLENVDWPHNNIKLWKNKNPENKGIDDKWRFILTDMDVTMESLKTIYEDAYLKGDPRRAYWEKGGSGALGKKLDAECISNFMFNSLLKNETFKNKFIGRYFAVIDHYFTVEYMTKLIDERFNETYHLRQEQISRYKGSWSYTNTKALKEWAKQRGKIAKEEIVNYFKLDKNAKDITVTLKCPKEQGEVYLCNIKAEDGKEVLVKTQKGYPVTFKAVAKEGYVFKYFSVDGVFWHNDTYTVCPGGNMNIMAVFEKV